MLRDRRTRVRPVLFVGRGARDGFVRALVASRTTGAGSHAEILLNPTDPEFPETGLRGSSLIRLNRLVILHRALVRWRLARIGPNTECAVTRTLRHVFPDRTPEVDQTGWCG